VYTALQHNIIVYDRIFCLSRGRKSGAGGDPHKFSVAQGSGALLG
jgi:hypothetical protein